MKNLLLSGFLGLVSSVATWATTGDDVLTQMDQAAAKFNGMTANLNRIIYTKVIDDKSAESGVIRLKKLSSRGLQVLIDFNKPDAKTVVFGGKKAEIYYPKLNTVHEYDLGKHSDLVDQFLLVGFGTTGKELKANYSVTYVGEETVNAQKTHRLELVPLNSQRKEKLRKMELWIAQDGIYPLQQKFLQPSGDYYLFTYSNVVINPALTDDAFKLTLPKGVKRERPQK